MESFTACPPWLQGEAGRLLAAVQANRLHHALLLTGIEGIGKHLFAQWLSEALLCQNRSVQGACRECAACNQLLADANPEFRQLAPEGASESIRIDPVRDLVEWLQLTASANSYRVALMTRGDTLNRQAANSLLKTLEEPADNAVLVLCATRAGRLPATVRSRCLTITLTLEDREAAIAWLDEQGIGDPEQALASAGNAPVLALTHQQAEYQQSQQLLIKAWSDLFLHKGSVGRIADSLSDLESSECLAVFARWCVLAAKKSADIEFSANPTVVQMVSETWEKLSDAQWFTLHERLLQLHRSDSASFKTKAVLEGLAADIRGMING